VFEIGSSLREARMRQKLELADVERATRIRAVGVR
jgi:cytoskeletal protein RodZ